MWARRLRLNFAKVKRAAHAAPFSIIYVIVVAVIVSGAACCDPTIACCLMPIAC
jgi:hypothetical protein